MGMISVERGDLEEILYQAIADEIPPEKAVENIAKIVRKYVRFAKHKGV